MDKYKDGNTFVSTVEQTTGRQLSNGKVVSLLFAGCAGSGDLRTFYDLAFVAKSFHKLSQRLARGIPDQESKASFRSEMEESVNRFRILLEKAAGTLSADLRSSFVNDFLLLTPGSFERMQTLLHDFSAVKDYFLMVRDSGRK